MVHIAYCFTTYGAYAEYQAMFLRFMIKELNKFLGIGLNLNVGERGSLNDYWNTYTSHLRRWWLMTKSHSVFGISGNREGGEVTKVRPLHCLCQDRLCRHWSRHSSWPNSTIAAPHWQDFRPTDLRGCSRYWMPRRDSFMVDEKNTTMWRRCFVSCTGCECQNALPSGWRHLRIAVSTTWRHTILQSS